MIEKNHSDFSGETERQKKPYSSPKIEIIANVRMATKGSTIGGTDSGGQSANVPSDPGGW
ncbi:hypothetical protein [Sulfurovum sp. NBC37-1]|uniref:hypothetical protein n=1 Tax=Sulfurovum sp. (strain NBC37-1) TaxID=387093 RepID=UPI0005A13D8A|nr:hypothetical protein [Sulfurovum sp. NBC37-1]